MLPYTKAMLSPPCPTGSASGQRIGGIVCSAGSMAQHSVRHQQSGYSITGFGHWGFMMRIFTLIGLSAATMLTPVAASAAQMTTQTERVSVMQAPTAAAADDRGRGGRGEARRGGQRGGPQANRNQGNRNQPVRAYREGRRDGAQQARQNYQRVERRDERNDQRRENRAYRDGRQDQRHVYRERRDDRRDNWRDNRRDDNRFEYQGRRHDRWNNNWRNDRRYNYSSYRASNRDRYRGTRYYAPHRGHNYRRFSIGFSIGAPYYASNYWINDPSYYRLPPAYGPYRWVRYYDDVLLIDVRNGYVVDVIHSFFW